MGKSQRIKTRHTGVYVLKSRRNTYQGKPDVCYYITYTTKEGKFVFERIGWLSDGVTEDDAVDARHLRVKANRTVKLNHRSALPFSITVNEAWLRFKEKHLPELKSSRQTEHIYLRHIFPEFGHRQILSISSLEIEEFKARLLSHGVNDGQPLKAGTVANIIGNFKRILNWAYKLKLVRGENPIAGITVKNAFKRRERYLTREEAEIIFDGLSFVSCDLFHIARIALNTGLRLNEILNLKGHDINIKQGTIQVRNGKTGERLAYIPHAFGAELARLIPACMNDFLFSKNGKKLDVSPVSMAFAKFIEATGLNEKEVAAEQKIVFHTLRHTFCSWLAIAGVPIYTIAHLAGHKTLSMTQRYAKLSPAIQRDALDALSMGKD